MKIKFLQTNFQFLNKSIKHRADVLYEYTTNIPLCVDVETVRKHLNQVVYRLRNMAKMPREYTRNIEKMGYPIDKWIPYDKFLSFLNESIDERIERVKQLEPTENAYPFTVSGSRALGRYAFSFEMNFFGVELVDGNKYKQPLKYSFLDLPAFVFDTDTNEIIPIDITEL